VYLGKLQEAGPRGTAGQGESEEGREAADCNYFLSYILQIT
jgi:hypothetical protein